MSSAHTATSTATSTVTSAVSSTGPRPTRRLAALLLGLGLLAGAPQMAQAQAGAVRLIVPVPAGGPTDQSARVVAKALAPLLGQDVVVDNRTGGNGAVGAQALVAAPADGSVLLYAPASLAALPVLMKAPPFRSLNDLTPVGSVGGNQICLFVHPALGVDSAKAFATLAKAQPDALSFGSSTPAEFFAATQVMQGGGLRLTRVPYRGSVQMLPDLLENRVQIGFMPPATGLAHVRSGKLRLLGCNAPQRLPGLAEVPTLVESGLSAGNLRPYHHVLAPAGLPAAQRDRLAAALQQVATDPAVRAELDKLLITHEALGPEQAREAIREAEQLWGRFVREAGIAPE